MRGRGLSLLVTAALAVVLLACASDPDPDVTPADDGDQAGVDPDLPDEPVETDEPDVPPLHPEVDDWDAVIVTISRADGNDVRVDARVAASDERRQRGLMHVEDVPDGAGMLFVYEHERTGAFWMKNTLVPLDIAFTGADGDIRAILTMEPCEADPCPTYDPEVEFATALEVPAGWFADNGVATGDELEALPWVPIG